MIGMTAVATVLDSRSSETYLNIHHICRPHFKTRLKIQMVLEVIFMVNLVTLYYSRQDVSTRGGLHLNCPSTCMVDKRKEAKPKPRKEDGFD